MPPPRLSSRLWLMDAALIGCSCLSDRYEGRPCQPPYNPNRFICSTGGTGSCGRARKALSLRKSSQSGSLRLPCCRGAAVEVVRGAKNALALHGDAVTDESAPDVLTRLEFVTV